MTVTLSALEVLRRTVLTERDGDSSPVRAQLAAMGYGVLWARVSGARVTAYLGGQEPDRPPIADAIVEGIGGRVSVGSSPVDRGWYEWTWTAPLEPVE